MNSTEQKMAAAILKYEDCRATGPAALRITRLPSCDKGGKWEIAGICDGIEPDVFNKIKKLLDSGRNDAAWKACLQYVMDNTAAIRNWIGSDKHPATEFFLRDHYFNSGSKNTGKILQRALIDNGVKLAVDGIVGQNTCSALQAYLSEKDEGEFLSDLRDRRRAFYISCSQYATFGKGWLRRTDEAFDFARTLIS